MSFDFFKVYQVHRKRRLGCHGDGGYVIADIGGYDCYISAGISDEESFSRDFIQHYHTTANFGFDGTIESYPTQYTTKVDFYAKNIGAVNDDVTTNLSDIMSTYTSMFLKMDIEGGEYPWLLHTSLHQLSKFKQIVIEFHHIHNDEGCSKADKVVCFKKLATTHYLIHAHGNTCCDSIHGMPNVLELTYLNKKCFRHIPPLNTTPLPLPIDYSNTETPQIQLKYPFVYSKCKLTFI